MPNSQMFVRDISSNKIVPLQVDANNKLNTSDSTAQSTLGTISSILSGSLSVNDSSAQLSLGSIESSLAGTISTSDNNAQSSLSNIESSLVGTLTVNDSNANLSLSSIDSKLAGTLATVVQTLSDKGGFGTQTVIDGDVSNNVDATGYRNCMVFGNLGGAGSIMIQVSNNNTEWYDDHSSEFFSNATSYHVAGRFQCITKHWRVKHKVSGSVEIRWAMQN